MLEVDRHTVQRRLRKVEEVLGRLLSDCHLKLEVALSLEEIGGLASLDEAISTP
jgi:DNA-binding PucR family transcriptional regulator